MSEQFTERELRIIYESMLATEEKRAGDLVFSHLKKRIVHALAMKIED